jgi:outer membrane protein, heavy metal efflux system
LRPETPILTLDGAIELALKQNPEIQLAVKKRDEARGQRLQMESVPNPEIMFSDEGLGLRKKSTGGMETEISFGMQQNLEFPGKRAMRAKMGRFGEERSVLDLERIRRIVRAAVKKSYFKALLSRRIAESLEANSLWMDQLIENLLIGYQAGSASYVDVLRARAEKARLQNQLIEEKRAGITARMELNLLLGRDGYTPIDFMTGMVYFPEDSGVIRLKEEVRTTRLALLIAAVKRRQTETGLKLAKMSLLPDFSFGLFSPSLRPNAWGFSVAVSVPLNWWKKQKGEILEAQAVHDMAGIVVRRTELRMKALVENALSGVAAAEEQVKLYEHTLLKEMEDELNISLSQYQFGKIEFFNLLDIYRTCAAVRLDHLKSLYLYFVSLADLEVAGEEYAE